VTPAALLAEVQGLGVSLTTPDGKRLVATPKGKLPPDLRAELSAHKAEVVAYLAAESPLMLPEPPKRGRYVPSAPIPTVCSWCGEPVTAPPGTLPLARRTVCGDLLHAACYAASTRDPGGRQPRTPDLDEAIRRANARAERDGTT
jgi:hypothetical protein